VAGARKVELDCDGLFSKAAKRVVKLRSKEVFAQAEGVLCLDDVEPVHDMRVATRRLRAALEVFESCFPRKRHRKALKKVKALAEALGERRDVDVEIALLEELREEAVGADRAAVTVLVEGTRTRQHVANHELAPHVAPKRLKRLRRRLKKLERRKGGSSLRSNIEPIVRERLKELRDRADDALAPDASRAQHKMRIAAKRLRYVLEIFGPCLEGEEAKLARQAAKQLQSVLGDLHDCDLTLERVEGIDSAVALLRERRELLFHRFVEQWQAEASKGTWAALEASL
jgi:CHAD domain-containing protein